MSAEPLVIDVRNLRIERDGTLAVRDVSWQVRAGEHWAILGPNGSGKTSLLRALVGYFPGRGEIALLGERFGAADWRELRTRVGLVSNALLPAIPPPELAWSTVVSGRRAMLGQWGEPNPGEETEARALLAEVGCAAIADRAWQVLSQGERQRVLIARALMSRPRLLILDEACSGLDPVARERFLAQVSGLAVRPDAPTLVLVTHHVEEIVPAISHVLLLAEGQVVAAGEKREVLTDALLSRAFDAPLVVTETHGRYALRLVETTTADQTDWTIYV